jgi:hypothetical protein
MQLKSKATASHPEQQHDKKLDDDDDDDDRCRHQHYAATAASSNDITSNKQSMPTTTPTTTATGSVAQKRSKKDIHSIAARIIKNLKREQPEDRNSHFHQHHHHHHHHHSDNNTNHYSSQLSNFSSDEEDVDDDSDDDEAATTSNTELIMHKHCGNAMATIAAAASFLDMIHRNSNSITRSTVSGNDVYFWQYNPLLKGPKRKKVLTWPSTDPHLPKEFLDPVVSLLELKQQQHEDTSPFLLNKFRTGDSNDVTPNTTKLFDLGLQINAFHVNSSALMSSCSSPSSPSSFNNNNNNELDKDKLNLRREKNKIASRACRLKKKAQHEANKIKLHGLNQEHAQLVETIHLVRQLIKVRVLEPEKLPAGKKTTELFHEICHQKLKTKVAGNSDGYVNAALLIAVTSSNNNNNNNSQTVSC